ncbi:MAG: ABC transporter permease [Simkaniaceae bacterium]
MQKIKALIKKEFIAVWQDKKSRMVLIIPPLLQLFIFSLAATLDVKNVSVGILNRDLGKNSFELVQRFIGSKTFKQLHFLDRVEQIQEYIDPQKVVMVLHIDEQFSRNIQQNLPAKVQLILDGRKSNTAQIVQGYALRIIERYSQELAAGTVLPFSALIARSWFNPNLIYPWFTVPGLVPILTMLIGLLLTAMSIARERELGTFEQLVVSPLTSIDILIGKVVPGILVGLIEGTVILLAGIFVFQVPFRGPLITLYLSFFVFVLAIIGIGLFLSSLCRTQQQALLSVFVFMAPAVALSGFATPIENMPYWLQIATWVNPLRHFLVIIRGVCLKSISIKQVMIHTYPIAIIAAINLISSVWFFKKKLE